MEEITEEYSKRVTRNQKARGMQEQDVICEEKREPKSETHFEPEPEPVPESKPEHELQNKPETETHPESESQTKDPETKEICNSRRNDEEDETRMAVQSICISEPNEEKENESSTTVAVTQEEQISKKELKHFVSTTEKDFKEKTEINESANKMNEKGISDDKAEPNVQEELEKEKSLEIMKPQEILCELQSDAKFNFEQSQVTQTCEKRRSSSRDSSEERAKEAALRSR